MKKLKPRPICQICKMEFTPKGNIALAKAKYCSRVCYGEWRRTNKNVLAHLKEIAPLGRKGWTKESQIAANIKMMGEKNPAWRGGKYIEPDKGYVMIRNPQHPRSRQNGYVLEHILVMEQLIGRYLTQTEVVHHINHNTQDNRPENLKLYVTHREHWLEHHKKDCIAANVESAKKKRSQDLERP